MRTNSIRRTDYMDDSDLNRKYRESRDDRIAGIEAINKAYDVTTEEINSAGADGGIKYASDDVWTYYFVAQCVSSAQGLVDNYISEGMDPDDIDEMVSQAADNCIPFQTYVLWSIWNECGQEVDAWQDFGMDSVEVDELFKIPQTQIFRYAERIINEYYEEEKARG